MKPLNYLFFYAYAGLALLAGFWGAFLYPHLDFLWLFHMNPRDLPGFSRINLLSQYRFLRAMEFGFGIYCFVFVKEIFRERKFNFLFLVTMASGTLARALAALTEGAPSTAMYFFMFFELAGIAIISCYSVRVIYKKQKKCFS